jgi:hypothetical protein
MITPSKFVVNRCSDYNTVEVASFPREIEAYAAFETLVRMSSSQRDFWYEVCEVIS